MHLDRYGLALATDSAEAAAAYCDGVDRMLASIEGAHEAFDRSIAADSNFALPHAAVARVHQSAGRSADAQSAASRAVQLATDGEVDDRQREAVAIQNLLATGRSVEALERIKAHVATHPTDAMVLAPASSVFGLIGFSGRADREAEQLEFLEPLVPHYGDDWWFQSVFAFALVETGRWDEGRELVEHSLELNPRSAHAAHVLAHAFYESGDDDRALAFLDDWLPGLDREASLHCHLWWHLCLSLIATGETERAWSLYDQHLAPDVSVSPPLNVFTDCTSLNWRAMLAGTPIEPARWAELQTFHQEEFGDEPGVFRDAHAALPLVGLGQLDAVDDYVEQVEAMDVKGKLPAGSMAVVMSKAFQAYGRQRWSDVIELLEPHLDQVVCIGGSRAQRDLAFNTVLSAYGRAERWSEAERLLARVTDRQPSRPVASSGASR